MRPATVTYRYAALHGVEVVQRDGWTSDDTPGLAVVANAGTTDRWEVIHASSGLVILCVQDPETAARALTMLGPAGDWTQPATGVHGDPALKVAAFQVMDQLNGHMAPNPVTRDILREASE